MSLPVDRHAVALVLDEIGTLLDLLGENRFKARAFQTAAREMDKLEGDVAALVASGELRERRGFGDVTFAAAQELVETGESSYHRDLRARTPSGLVEMLGIPGLGARRIHTLHERLGVDTVDDLLHAAKEGRVAALKGFGPKTQQAIIEGIAYLSGSAGRRRQNTAYQAAARLIGHLEAHPAVRELKLAGELRRRCETVDGIDVIASTGDADRDAVIDAFLAVPGLTRAERRAGHATLVAVGRLADGLELRLHLAEPRAFPTAWIFATGGAAHLDALRTHAEAAGFTIGPDALRKGSRRRAPKEESAVYEALGLQPIPPELRETGDEVAAAAEGALPTLVDAADLRGTFHCHTTFSDGKASVRQLGEAARERGWRYLGIADHSQAAGYANGLSPQRVRAQHRMIDAWNAEHGDEVWLFKGVEADILSDGRVDYSDDEELLASFDYVVASVHSAFRIGEAAMTKRVIRALENPFVTILGHPTGRLLLTREEYPIDLDAVIDAAANLGKAIELNSDPRRLDMDWRWWRRAREQGVKCAIDPDAHSVAGLDNVFIGVGLARKGWLTPDDVINAWPIDDVRAWFARGRD